MSKRPYRCSYCLGSGHQYRNCPLSPEGDGLHDLPRWKRYVVRRQWEGNCAKCGKDSQGRYRCRDCNARKQLRRRKREASLHR